MKALFVIGAISTLVTMSNGIYLHQKQDDKKQAVSQPAKPEENKAGNTWTMYPAPSTQTESNQSAPSQASQTTTSAPKYNSGGIYVPPSRSIDYSVPDMSTSTSPSTSTRPSTGYTIPKLPPSTYTPGGGSRCIPDGGGGWAC